MSDTINNGGPAFPLAPVSHHENVVVLSESVATGMTLRDYFAAKAMQGYIHRAVTELDMEDVAIDAYEMADAMLHAREAK